MKMYKNLIRLILITTLFLAQPVFAFAQSASPSTGNKTGRLSTVNTNCQNAVSERLNSLNSVEGKINSLKRLSASQKQEYLNEVSTNISGLQSAQSQCTTDFNGGNLSNLVTDRKSVYTTYRIYAEMLPQLHLLVASDTMGYTANNLLALYTKLQARVQEAGNPSNLTSLLSDMNTKITDAQTQYSNVESQIASLTPSSYNSNPSGTTSIFQTAKSEIKTGASDLQAAFSDARQIVQALKALKASPTPAPSSSTQP